MSLNIDIKVPYEIPTLCYTAETILIILLFKIWRKAVYLKGEPHVLSLPSPHTQSKLWFQQWLPSPELHRNPDIPHCQPQHGDTSRQCQGKCPQSNTDQTVHPLCPAFERTNAQKPGKGFTSEHENLNDQLTAQSGHSQRNRHSGCHRGT